MGTSQIAAPTFATCAVTSISNPKPLLAMIMLRMISPGKALSRFRRRSCSFSDYLGVPGYPLRKLALGNHVDRRTVRPRYEKKDGGNLVFLPERILVSHPWPTCRLVMMNPSLLTTKPEPRPFPPIG